MPRTTTSRRAGAVLGLVTAAALGLAGCGSSSATASSDPTTTTVAPSSSPSTSPPPPATSTTEQAPQPAPTGDPGALTTAPAASTLPTGPDGSVAPIAPSTVPGPGAPGVPEAVQTEAEARVVATLEANGVAVGSDPANASSVVNLVNGVCSELANGGDRQAVTTALLAVGQLIAAAGPSSISPEQFAQLLVAIGSDPANCN